MAVLPHPRLNQGVEPVASAVPATWRLAGCAGILMCRRGIRDWSRHGNGADDRGIRLAVDVVANCLVWSAWRHRLSVPGMAPGCIAPASAGARCGVVSSLANPAGARVSIDRDTEDCLRPTKLPSRGRTGSAWRSTRTEPTHEMRDGLAFMLSPALIPRQAAFSLSTARQPVRQSMTTDAGARHVPAPATGPPCDIRERNVSP